MDDFFVVRPLVASARRRRYGRGSTGVASAKSIKLSKRLSYRLFASFFGFGRFFRLRRPRLRLPATSSKPFAL